jgi:hypothetical protein
MKAPDRLEISDLAKQMGTIPLEYYKRTIRDDLAEVLRNALSIDNAAAWDEFTREAEAILKAHDANPETKELDTDAIRVALEAGIEVPGCSLEKNRIRLDIK